MGNKKWNVGDLVVSHDNRYKGKVDEIKGNNVIVDVDGIRMRFGPNELKRQFLGK